MEREMCSFNDYFTKEEIFDISGLSFHTNNVKEKHKN